MRNNAQALLERGSELLKPLLHQHGFAYGAHAGESSGGQFAGAEFLKSGCPGCPRLVSATGAPPSKSTQKGSLKNGPKTVNPP
jgi:hypothetical protein